MPATWRDASRPLFMVSAVCFLIRTCLRGALYNTHNMPCLRRAFQYRPPILEIAKIRTSSKFNFIFPKPNSTIRQNTISLFDKSFLSNLNLPRFSAPANPRQNRRKKKRADIRRAPEREKRTIPYLEFSESPAPSDSPPSPCAPSPSASSSSTSGMV